MFCCKIFETTLRNAGKRGLAIVPTDKDGRRYFRIQSRGCDAEAIPRFPPGGVPGLRGVGPLNLVTSTGFRYCPFCGADLKAWIEHNGSEFDAAVAEFGHCAE